MCGIAGAVRIGDRELVERMTSLMTYRGPDDYGIYEDGDLRLGHRRLSILDLSAAGHQPMQTDDGNLVITYNGEIYNFLELRCDLEKKGYRFCSGTDTETLLFAYREYGLQFLERLEGMFAFGLWDRTLGQLILARDRIGIKPLFYHQHDGGLAFASELKPLLCLPHLQRTVNRPALRSVIRYGCNLENESLLASIFKLPPGTVLVWREGNCTLTEYYRQPMPSPERWNEADLASELRTRLGRAVKSHMISDAPLGAALSGGLDSSGIVALMAATADAEINTFTVGHGADDPDLLSSRLVAEHCRTNHREIIVSEQNVAQLLPRIVWHLEEPLGQMETVQMYVNNREAAKFVKVLLVGEGADECFGGYKRYKLFNPRLPLPFPIRSELYERVYQHSDEAPASVFGRVLARSFWGSPPASPLSDSHPRAASPMAGLKRNGQMMEQILNYDQRTILPHLYLKRADALGMAQSLELRVPFLAREMVELAARVPGQLMVKNGTEKYILRRALEPLLPPSITWRRKHPLQMKVNPGLVNTLDYMCDHLLRPADVRARGFFDPVRVDSLRRKKPGASMNHTAWKFWSWRIWSMVQCEMWARMFLDRLPSSQPPESLAELL